MTFTPSTDSTALIGSSWWQVTCDIRVSTLSRVSRTAFPLVETVNVTCELPQNLIAKQEHTFHYVDVKANSVFDFSLLCQCFTRNIHVLPMHTPFLSYRLCVSVWLKLLMVQDETICKDLPTRIPTLCVKWYLASALIAKVSARFGWNSAIIVRYAFGPPRLRPKSLAQSQHSPTTPLSQRLSGDSNLSVNAPKLWRMILEKRTF